jgi:hypothetical protein
MTTTPDSSLKVLRDGRPQKQVDEVCGFHSPSGLVVQKSLHEAIKFSAEEAMV